MTVLDAWLRRLIGTALLFGFLELLLPEGELHRFARMVMGLLVVLILLEPLAGILHQRIVPEELLAVSTRSGPGALSPPMEAARLTTSGLAALAQAGQAEMERAIPGLCARETGADVPRVRVRLGTDGQFHVTIWLHDGSRARQVKDLVAGHYTLPPAAVEVIQGE